MDGNFCRDSDIALQRRAREREQVFLLHFLPGSYIRALYHLMAYRFGNKINNRLETRGQWVLVQVLFPAQESGLPEDS